MEEELTERCNKFEAQLESRDRELSLAKLRATNLEKALASTQEEASQMRDKVTELTGAKQTLEVAEESSEGALRAAEATAKHLAEQLEAAQEENVLLRNDLEVKSSFCWHNRPRLFFQNKVNLSCVQIYRWHYGT